MRSNTETVQQYMAQTYFGLRLVLALLAFSFPWLLYAGAKLSKDAETDFNKRREHRTLALSSMALTLVSGLAMKLYNK